jgi:hypothetical protein
MTKSNVNILDNVEISTSVTASDVSVTDIGKSASLNSPLESSNTKASMIDNIKNCFTKKNIYILCAIIVIGIIAYYFLYKKKNMTESKDVTISMPSNQNNTENNLNNNYILPMPKDPNANRPIEMTEEDYMALMQQQQQQQQQPQQQQQIPQIIHPNQNITDDNETQSQEPSLTAKEIQNISNQLHKMQKEVA